MRVKIFLITGFFLLVTFSFLNADDFSAWKYSEKVVLNTTGASLQGDIKNLPVLLELEDSFDFSKAKDNGADIRFSSSDGSNLSYTVDKWDENKAEIWVLVPVVKANNSGQFITFHFGNNEAGSEDDEESVFNKVEHDCPNDQIMRP